MPRFKAKAPSYWFDGSPIPLWARLSEPFYAAVVRLRRSLLCRLRSKRRAVPVPVIVVGNLITGGAGKTPVTIALANYLANQGWTPGVASRGYGRQEAKTPRWVDARTSARLGGDEAVLIASKLNIPVRVDIHRLEACQALAAAGCDVIISDDGLQHYQLARDIEIEVIDGTRRYGNGHLLPAGPLREPIKRANVCDFRILTSANGPMADRSEQSTARYREWTMQIKISTAIPLCQIHAAPRPLSNFAGQRVHAIAGTAYPERFFAMLRACGLAVIPHAFPDHHAYRASDLEFSSHLPILMTEKDAVKCQAFATEWSFVVPLETQLPHTLGVILLDRLQQLKRQRSELTH